MTAVEERLDDHQVAELLARGAADALVDLLEEARDGRHGWSLEYVGDRLAHDYLVAELERLRPDDAVLSEEGDDDQSRLTRDRVWIVDPLDGSSNYGRSGHWAVHVGLVEGAEPVAGAVAVPAWGETFTSAMAAPPRSEPEVPPRILVSRSRASRDGPVLATGLGAEVAALGSAGVKAMAVVRGSADGYVHAGDLFEWDYCAPAAVARAAGLHVSAIDGSPLAYNSRWPWSRGLVVCHPDLAAPILELFAAA